MTRETPCIHCWHCQTRITNGLGLKGYDVEKCCHCGAIRYHAWVHEHDPIHGPHVNISLVRFTGAAREEPTS